MSSWPLSQGEKNKKSPTQEEAGKGKGISVSIGLNSVNPSHYAGWVGTLNACEADAADMAALATSQGFDAGALLTTAATRTAVIEAVTAAAAKLVAGDFFLLTYSGHGGQVPDMNNDEVDGLDETWCLYDGELIDDELAHLWAKFAAGVRVLVLSDSCHSGTVLKVAFMRAAGELARELGGTDLDADEPRFRAMPSSVALRTFRQNQDFYTQTAAKASAQPDIKAFVRLILGCQDNQLSLDGAFNGLFTATLLRVWKSGTFKGCYDDFVRSIRKLMPPTQTPNHYYVGVRNQDYDKQRPFSI